MSESGSSGGGRRRRQAVQIMIEYLEKEGVQYVFGIPGKPLGPLFELLNESSITPVRTTHESGAAFMADGYARFSGHIGVCAGTSGPGMTNLVTGVANAYADHVPLLVLTGQVQTDDFGKGAFQESTSDLVDAVSLFRNLTKWSESAFRGDLVPRYTRKALRVAQTGRPGPVALSLPFDSLVEELEADVPGVYEYRVHNRAFDRHMVARTSRALLEARAPCILAGFGVKVSGAHDELVALAERWRLPVLTTPKGKGAISERHPLALGVHGFAGHPRAEAFIRDEADLILAVGTSLGQWQSDNYSQVLESKSIHQIDIDPAEIGKNYPIDVGHVGDVQVILKEIGFQLERDLKKRTGAGPSLEARQARLDELGKRYPRYRNEDSMFSSQIPPAPQRLMRELRAGLPDEASVFFDTGAHMIWGLHYFDALVPHSFVLASGFCCMGYGVCAPMGAKLARPDLPVAAVVGDGCFLMHGMEITTAVNLELPVVWIVMNNGELGMVHQGQTALYGRGTATRFRPVDFARVAQAMGADGVRIERIEDFPATLRSAFDTQRPTVIDCVIDPACIPPARTNAGVPSNKEGGNKDV